MMEAFIGGLIGFVAGVIVNALADDLPYRRRPGLPTYPDGTPRPLLAWSGLGAYLFGLYVAASPAPNSARSRLPWYVPPEHADGRDEDELPAVDEAPAPLAPASLNWRYPLAELLTIVLCALAVSVAQSKGISAGQLAFWLAYVAIYVLITVIDIEYKLILFIVVIPAAALALLNALLLPEAVGSLQNALWGAAAGFVPFFILYQGGFLFTYILGQARGEKIDTVAFGYGDVMLMTLSGLILGLDRTIIALFITVFLGALGAVGYMLLRAVLSRRYSLFTAIPYGPYIVAATLMMLFYGDVIRKALLGY